DAALAVEADVDDEIAAGQLGDARVLLVHGVADDAATVGPGMLQEARAVPDLDRLQGGDAGADDLAAAGVARHQVRLDQAGRDLQVGPQITAVQVDRHPVGRGAEVVVLFQHLAVVVFHAVVGGDVGAEQLDQFLTLVGPVQPGGNEDQDVAAGDAL